MEQEKFYHVYNRGNNKQPVFFETVNYYYFLKQFEKYLSGFVDVYAYCLMPNHFHFLIKVLKQCENAFKNFFISYTKSVNERYGRTGGLFQPKFKRKEIIDDSYFTAIIQYIHANPIAAGLCKTYDDWEFSSYKTLIGNGETNINRTAVLEWFGNRDEFIKVHEQRQLERNKINLLLF
jgi:REP element-mobilizing transposase RayT